MPKSVSFSSIPPRVMLSFDPSSAFGLVDQYCTQAGVTIPNRTIREVMTYLVSNMDMNLALAATFWEPIALEKYAQASGSVPGLSKLNKKQLNLVMSILKPLGLEFFSICFRNGIFKQDQVDTFPYIVRSVDHGMVVLQEDI